MSISYENGISEETYNIPIPHLKKLTLQDHSSITTGAISHYQLMDERIGVDVPVPHRKETNITRSFKHYKSGKFIRYLSMTLNE